MGFLSKLNKFFRAVDLFPTSKLIRYNGESEYTTVTGGLISTAVLVIFIILFSSMGIRTIRKEIIITSKETAKDIEPGELNVTLGPGHDFMFAIFVNRINLNAKSNRLFDVNLYQEKFTSGHYIKESTLVPLEMCTQTHFNFNDNLKTLSQRLPLAFGLCPPIGYQFTIKGKISSQLYNHLKINVTRCNATEDSTCASDAIFAATESQMRQFTIATPLINNNINPNSEEYRQFYLDNKHMFTFSSDMGITAAAFLEEDVVKTDTSIFLFPQELSENIINIPQYFTPSNFLPKVGDHLAEIQFRKSHTTTTYTRSFSKLDSFFSYVGGLVGTIIGLIFIMSFYTEKAFEVSLAHKIFLDNNNQEIQSSDFNIGYFLSMNIKKILNLFRIDLNWPKTQLFLDCCEELAMQIDITYITRKLMFLDSAVSKLLEKHELEALYLRKKPTMNKVKYHRKMHFAPQMFEQEEKRESEHPFCYSVSPLGKGNQIYQENQIKSYEYNDGDFSAQNFSRPEMDLVDLKKSVTRVVKEAKGGKDKNQRIVQEISPQLLMKLGNRQVKKHQTIEIQSLSEFSQISNTEKRSLNLHDKKKNDLKVTFEENQKD